MREEYNSVLSTRTEADIDISVKPKYRPIYRSISRYDNSDFTGLKELAMLVTQFIFVMSFPYLVPMGAVNSPDQVLPNVQKLTTASII